jgi:hypothetical protein
VRNTVCCTYDIATSGRIIPRVSRGSENPPLRS